MRTELITTCNYRETGNFLYRNFNAKGKASRFEKRNICRIICQLGFSQLSFSCSLKLPCTLGRKCVKWNSSVGGNLTCDLKPKLMSLCCCYQISINLTQFLIKLQYLIRSYIYIYMFNSYNIQLKYTTETENITN